MNTLETSFGSEGSGILTHAKSTYVDLPSVVQPAEIHFKPKLYEMDPTGMIFVDISVTSTLTISGSNTF